MKSSDIKKESKLNYWKKGEGSIMMRVPMGLVEPVKDLIKAYRFARDGGLAKLIQREKEGR